MSELETSAMSTSRSRPACERVGRICPQRAVGVGLHRHGALGTDAPYRWRLSLLAMLPVILFLASACNRSEERIAATPVPAIKPPTALEEAPVLSEEDSALFKSATLPASEAEKEWRALQKAIQPPGFPAEWQTNQPTKEQVAQFEKQNGILAAEAAGKLRQFYTKYPTNENVSEARRREFDLLKVAVDLGNTNALSRIEALEEQRLKDPSLSDDERIGLRVEQIQRLLSSATDATITNALAKVETAMRKLQADFPERTDLVGMTTSLADIWFKHGDFQKSRTLAEEVLKSKAEEDSKESAAMLLKQLNHVGKPLELKFAALDGRELDLKKLRGKVVLIDFWATWCAPCMRELPNVKAVYEKLHDKGFEVLGLSYDEDKAALQQVVSTEAIPWPQAFDEAEPGKKFAEQFGVTALPTMWLVDKNGVLSDPFGVKDLESKVQKLLAAK